jgi:transcriptional regulator with XRE-family HTH domain
MEGLGQRVIALRRVRGWTRRELAKRAGLHEQHLANVEWEHRTRLESDTLVKLADALHCTTDYLLGRTTTPGGPRPRPRTAAPVG